MDEKLKKHIKAFGGMAGKIIGHECDYIAEILFINLLSPRERKLLKRKLEHISKGKIRVDYKTWLFSLNNVNVIVIWSIRSYLAKIISVYG